MKVEQTMARLQAEIRTKRDEVRNSVPNIGMEEKITPVWNAFIFQTFLSFAILHTSLLMMSHFCRCRSVTTESNPFS
jgi:hypothetical protein